MNTESAQLFTPAEPWTGRNDGPGTEHARWHSTVDTETIARGEIPQAAVALLGFASDEGVERNGGRQGAAAGPRALRQALGSLAIHDEHKRYDAGTVTTQGTDLDGAHNELSRRVEELVKAGNLTIVLGGGHETAFGSHRGAYRAGGNQPLKIINVDAHFDLRTADRATSGTPFKQIADLVRGDHGTDSGAFDYSVFGISRPNNTAVLFNTALELGVDTVLDEELIGLSPTDAALIASRAVAHSPHEAVHLSIDLDVLPAAQAPGVSAPAGMGVEYATIRAMALAIAATGKLKLVDVVELNPSFDIDARTAKAAARLIDDIVTEHLKATSSTEQTGLDR